MALSRSINPRIGSTVRISSQQQWISQQKSTATVHFSTSSSSSAAEAPSATSSSSSTFSPLAPKFLPGSKPVTLPSRMKPASPSFYTAKPTLVDSIILLEDLARRTKRALEQNSVPIDLQATAQGVSAARRSLVWPKVDELSQKLSIPLKSGQYRHIIARLSALARYRYFVQEYLANGRCGEQNRALALEVENTLQNFNRIQGKDDRLSQLPHHASFLSSSSGVDHLGRAYARGRRKESSARVWIVPSHNSGDERSASAGMTMSSSVLINAQPLSEYFTRASDREAILFPLRLLGMMGAFNVFALVRGGGTTGQTGAVAHGLARSLVSFFDEKARKVEDSDGLSSPTAQPLREQASNFRKLLSRTEVLHRDSRMVERKKTGKAKSRKAYTWVKR